MKQLCFALGVLALSACARPVVPEGGPKDTTPPQVVPEKSTPNFSIRFNAREFYLTFDEWVVLQDALTQVLVSPPLAKRPDVSLKGRTVTLKFREEEVLRPNTTYTINFGTAIKDLHESNPAKDLRFVFSTGDYIDSLSVSGSVVDAFTGDPVENIAVMLYDNLNDSIIRKERPYYLARTDKGGQFSIPNVRAGAFKCVAVEDANANMKWDGEAERIGFPDAVVLVSDTLKTLSPLRVFKPVPALRLLSQQAGRYGVLRLGFSSPPDEVALKPDWPDLKWQVERDQDSLLVWYDTPADGPWKLLAGTDTVSVKALSRAEFIAKNRLEFDDERPASSSADRKRLRQAEPIPAAPAPAAARPPKQVIVSPGKSVLLPFPNALAALDTSRWQLYLDSLPLRTFSAKPDSARLRAVRLHVDWALGKNYRLLLLPGAVTDFYGTTNTDTLRRNFTVPTEKQLGTLSLTVQNLNAGQSYILRLMNGNNLEEERRFVADSTAEKRFSLPYLQPVTYTAQLIEDRNRNGRWDAGDYYAHRQPEPVTIRKMEALRANWEVEAVLEARSDRGKRKKVE